MPESGFKGETTDPAARTAAKLTRNPPSRPRVEEKKPEERMPKHPAGTPPMRQPAIQECLMSVAFGAKMENSSSKVFGEFKVGCEDAYLKFCDVVRAFRRDHPGSIMPIGLFDSKAYAADSGRINIL